MFLADPEVGGRYSALTAFGLVPSCLAGVDVAALLDAADAVAPSLGADDGPALLLGAALGAGTDQGGRVARAGARGRRPPGVRGLGRAARGGEHRQAGHGILPVVTGRGPGGGADFLAPRTPLRRVRTGAAPAAGDGLGSAVTGPLGALFLVWEFATAVAGRVLGINPFDQPDVESAKDAARGMLDQRPEPEPATLTDGAVEVRGSAALLAGVDTLAGALHALTAALGPDGYLAVTAYLDRTTDARAEALRPALTRRVERPVTFGWGPRFLHSTGQLHKGGPPVGVFLQLTGAVLRTRGCRAASSPSASCWPRRRPGTPPSSPSTTGRCSACTSSTGPPVSPRSWRPSGEHRPGVRARARQPAARPPGPAAPPGPPAVRAGRVRGDRRPRPQEADPGGLRPRQPGPAAAQLRAARLRPPRLG